jgi:CheY-like chemotaxis protein
MGGSRSSYTVVSQGHRVLLAEDNPVNQIVARGFLTEVGCTVEVTAHARKRCHCSPVSRKALERALSPWLSHARVS